MYAKLRAPNKISSVSLHMKEEKERQRGRAIDNLKMCGRTPAYLIQSVQTSVVATFPSYPAVIIIEEWRITLLHAHAHTQFSISIRT